MCIIEKNPVRGGSGSVVNPPQGTQEKGTAKVQVASYGRRNRLHYLLV